MIFGFHGYGVTWTLVEMARAAEDFRILKNRVTDTNKDLVLFLVEQQVFEEIPNGIRCCLLDKLMARQLKQQAAGKKAALARWAKKNGTVIPEFDTKPSPPPLMFGDMPDVPKLKATPKPQSVDKKSKTWLTNDKLWLVTRSKLKEKHPDMPLEYLDLQKEKMLNHFSGNSKVKDWTARLKNWLVSRYADPYEPEKVAEPDPFLSEYKSFCKNQGVPPKLDQRDYKAMESIKTYLIDASEPDGGMDTDQVALGAWQIVLTNWDKVDPFIRKQFKLEYIDRNLMSIIQKIKGHGKNEGNQGIDLEARFGS